MFIYYSFIYIDPGGSKMKITLKPNILLVVLFLYTTLVLCHEGHDHSGGSDDGDTEDDTSSSSSSSSASSSDSDSDSNMTSTPILFDFSDNLGDSGYAQFAACVNPANNYLFECSNYYGKSKGMYVTACNCMSPEYLATVSDCFVRVKNVDLGRAVDMLINDCNSMGIVLDRSAVVTFYNNATNYFIDQESITEDDASQIFYSPIRLSQETITANLRSFAGISYNRYTGQLYG